MIEPTKRKVWWSNEAKAYWKEKFRKAEQLFRQLEILSVEEGERKVCTRHYPPEVLPEKQGELLDRGLHFLPLQRVGNYSGFAHGHPQPTGNNWNYYGVVGQSLDDCREFQKASNQGDHDTIGRLLGFPEEARNFFTEHFVEKENYDPIDAIKREDTNIARPHFLTNIGLRYFGFRMITFFPSSWKSDDALEFGKMFHRLADNQLDAQALDIMETLLKMPYIWSSLHGVAQIWTPLFQGIVNTNYKSDEDRILVLPEDMEIPEKGKIPRDLRQYV